MKRHVHEGTPACKPRTFQNRTGEPAKGVPYFACKKFAGGKKYAALVLAVSLWIAGGGMASAAQTLQTSLYIVPTEASRTNHDVSDYPNDATVTVTNNNKTLTVDRGTWRKDPYEKDWGKFYTKSIFSQTPVAEYYTLNLNNATLAYGGVTLCGTYFTNQRDNARPLSSQYNAVVISDSTFTGQATIYGAYGSYIESNSSNALKNNVVTIAGSLGDDNLPKTRFLGNADIYAVFDNVPRPHPNYNPAQKNAANENTVNLYGATAMENVSLHGCNHKEYNNDISSGTTLRAEITTSFISAA